MDFDFDLSGEVGGREFCGDKVRRELGKCAGRHVNVRISSFGGSLGEALEISSQFRDHGDVTVHFRGANASAATIASMGARERVISPDSMYLVHKASIEMRDFRIRNADQLHEYIKELQRKKCNLDNVDLTVAELYGSRCKRDAKALLDLMKEERWLSASQALEWGFVDRVSDDEGKRDDCSDSVVMLSMSDIRACAAQGHRLPPCKVISDACDGKSGNGVGGCTGAVVLGNGSVDPGIDSFAVAQEWKPGPFLSMVGEIYGRIRNFFIGDDMNGNVSNVGSAPVADGGSAAVVAGESVVLADGGVDGGGVGVVSDAVDGAAVASGEAVSAVDEGAVVVTAAEIEELRNRVTALEAENRELMSRVPGAVTNSVIAGSGDPNGVKAGARNGEVDQFFRTSASSRKLFDSLPD